MKGFFQKAKAELRGITQQRNVQENDCPRRTAAISEPTALDILRYRYHHGTNLGSIYVVERWLTSSRFPDGAEGSSELASVKAWVDQIGLEGTRIKFEEAWANALSDEDIQWLAYEAKATTVRLPIGYFDLPGPEFTRGTPFEEYAYVYEGAWNSIRTLMSRLRAHSIGVLVDMHALPGGANGQEHSGTNSNKTELWGNPFNLDLGKRCFEFIARDAQTGSDIAGLQLANEAIWDAPGMYEWYDECIAAVAAIDPSIPIIISDGWNVSRAIGWTLQKNSVYQAYNPVIIDTHYYWAYTDEDKAKSPQQITSEVNTKLSELDGKEGSVIDRGAVQVVVGEYSCVLTEDSWAKSGGVPKEDLVKQFGQTESRRWQARAGGSFFWTLKMDWMPGGEWGFKEQVDLGNIVPPPVAQLDDGDRSSRAEYARAQRNDRMYKAIQEHIAYWKGVDPNGHYEHEKYEHGWKVGYQDALTFFQGLATPGDRIGMLEMWMLKRIRDSGYRGGFTWLFEQGLRKGVSDLYDVVGI